METLAASLLLAAIAAYVLWFSRLSRHSTGPRLWPLVGSLPGLLHNSHRLHDWIADNLRSAGGTYQTCTLALPFLARRQGLTTVTCDPRNLEHVLKTRFHNYPKGPAWHAVFLDLLGDGIFNSDGETWLLQRKTAALEFTTRTLRHAMSRWVSRAVHCRLLPILDAAREAEKPVDLQDLLLRLTFDNICGLTFGSDPETLAPGLPENEFAAAFDRATEATLHRFLLPGFLWRLRKLLKLGMEVDLRSSVAHVQRHLSSVLKARKLDLRDDLLSRFMRRGDHSDDSLRHVALNFILAGRDTSSVALSWFFWLLIRNPQKEEKVLHEICSVLMETRGDEPASWVDSELTYDEVDRLVYLKAALSETLRLYPSVPEDSKHVLEDDTWPDGTFVPAGSAVTYSIYALGRMRWVWGEDCMEFRPERWAEGEQRDRFRFVAFNGGPRVCLGKEMAYLQMRAVAAAVLLRFRLQVAEGHRVEQKMSLTLFMKQGLRVKVLRRELGAVVEMVRRERRKGAGEGGACSD